MTASHVRYRFIDLPHSKAYQLKKSRHARVVTPVFGEASFVHPKVVLRLFFVVISNDPVQPSPDNTDWRDGEQK
jgi:hypothetical protein